MSARTTGAPLRERSPARSGRRRSAPGPYPTSANPSATTTTRFRVAPLAEAVLTHAVDMPLKLQSSKRPRSSPRLTRATRCEQQPAELTSLDLVKALAGGAHQFPHSNTRTNRAGCWGGIHRPVRINTLTVGRTWGLRGYLLPALRPREHGDTHSGASRTPRPRDGRPRTRRSRERRKVPRRRRLRLLIRQGTDRGRKIPTTRRGTDGKIATRST